MNELTKTIKELRQRLFEASVVGPEEVKALGDVATKIDAASAAISQAALGITLGMPNQEVLDKIGDDLGRTVSGTIAAAVATIVKAVIDDAITAHSEAVNGQVAIAQKIAFDVGQMHDKINSVTARFAKQEKLAAAVEREIEDVEAVKAEMATLRFENAKHREFAEELSKKFDRVEEAQIVAGSKRLPPEQEQAAWRAYHDRREELVKAVRGFLTAQK